MRVQVGGNREYPEGIGGVVVVVFVWERGFMRPGLSDPAMEWKRFW